MKKRKNFLQTPKTVTVYDRLYIIIALIAVSSVIAPYMYVLTYFNFDHPVIFSVCLTFISVSAGYAIQWIFGTVVHIKRTDDSSAYDNTDKFFKPHQAVLTILIAVIAGFILRNMINDYLRYREEIFFGKVYDRYMIIPTAIMALAVASAITGIIIWFYPFGRIISVKTILPLITIFFINYTVTLVYGGVSQLFLTFCFLVFIVCSFVLLNQSNIFRTYVKTKTVKITTSARSFNIALISVVILVFFAVLFVAVTFMVGIAALVKITTFFILSSYLRYGEVYEEADKIAESFNDHVFGGLIDPFDISGKISKIFFIIFIIIIIGIIIFFITNRRRETWALIKKFIINLYNNIIDFITNVLHYKRKIPETYTIADYRDEEIKMDESAVKVYEPQKIQKKSSFNDFMSRLNSLKSNGDKLQYAYVALINLWKHAHYGISSSDTPREIRDKILYKSSESEINDITDVFEKLKYANENIDSFRAGKTIDSMCRIIKRYFD